jgi:hypothetical protein
MSTDKLECHKWSRNGMLYHNDTINSKGLTCPAFIDSDGTCRWIKYGNTHRDDVDEYGKILPAGRNMNRSVYWYQYGHNHNLSLDSDGKLLPAILYDDESFSYYAYGFKLKDNRNLIPRLKILSAADVPSDVDAPGGVIVIPDEYIDETCGLHQLNFNGILVIRERYYN